MSQLLSSQQFEQPDQSLEVEAETPIPIEEFPASAAQPIETSDQLHQLVVVDPWSETEQEVKDLATGHVDSIRDGAVYGWCYSGIPGKIESIQVTVDNNYVADVPADQYRADLDRAAINNGVCAFVWKIPDDFRDDHDHLIQLCTSKGTALPGSPIRIRGLVSRGNDPHDASSATPQEPIDLSNIVVNSQLEGLGHQRVLIAKGANHVADGWEVYSDSNSIGHTSYWPSMMELYGFSVCNVIRIRGGKPIKLLRLFGTLRQPDCYFFLPFTLSFYLGNLNPSNPISLNVRLGTKTEDGKFETYYKTAFMPGIGSRGDISISVPADIVNNILKQDGLVPAVVFEFTGHVNLEIGNFKLGIGSRPLDLVPNISGSFEDPVIEDQYTAIQGFLEAGNTKHAEASPPIWRSWPGQQLPEIIVPVYDALEHVQACLHSVVENTECPHLLTIIDDGSTPDCGAWLDAFATGKPWVKVLHNGHNLGYTRSINRAIRESTGSAIILLNSDTIVSPGWLIKMMAVAESDPTTGLVGPLSNAASWQSVPNIKDESGAWAINSLPDKVGVAEYAELVASAGSGEHPEVPILNGFCLYIKRQVLDSIGLFDEEAFPQGYGEENDFCFRAADAGFRLKVVTDAYVYHAKTKSFGTQRRKELIGAANEVLQERYGQERFRQLESNLASLAPLAQLRAQLQGVGSQCKESAHG